MNETLKTLLKLRTIHGNFSDKPIAKDDLTAILRASVRAANASARQSYSIVVVDKDKKRELKWPGAEALLFCVDFTRLVDTAKHVGETFDAESFLPFLTGVVDTTLAVQNAVVAAKALGIDSLITNRVYRGGEIERVRDVLGLPDKHCFPLLLVCLGYPTKEPAYQKGRLEDLGVIHRGFYRRLSEDEVDLIVQQYDDPEQHLGLNDDWHSQGFKHYLSWFFAKWSKGVENREQAQALLDAVRSAGFFRAEGKK
jgi:FMN reductase [NAD(P)H]